MVTRVVEVGLTSGVVEGYFVDKVSIVSVTVFTEVTVPEMTVVVFVVGTATSVRQPTLPVRTAGMSHWSP